MRTWPQSGPQRPLHRQSCLREAVLTLILPSGWSDMAVQPRRGPSLLSARVEELRLWQRLECSIRRDPSSALEKSAAATPSRHAFTPPAVYERLLFFMCSCTQVVQKHTVFAFLFSQAPRNLQKLHLLIVALISCVLHPSVRSSLLIAFGAS